MKRLLQAVATRLGLAPRPTTSVRPVPPRQAPATPAPRPTAARHAPVPGPPPHHETQKLLEYAPQLDGDADPGEIVWTWVPYEDDPAQGKDRPVLVVGRQGAAVLGLMLSSQSERNGQHNWFALGPGSWDREKRPSWVRLDRVLTVDADGIRREGAILDRDRFDRVAAELRSSYGWS
ncbi:type II toxin-antitoxin system PemK/MazF family toxin [Dactylosporangium salmoneum]|uniref:type II toxin-antitoxin system PemK/MazF family toxin n=1 Tax=Dactylosporangium salmoneum TaxID=53361 RepID=UPI0031D8442F